MSNKTLLEAAQALVDVLPKPGPGLNAYHARAQLMDLRRAIADEVSRPPPPNNMLEVGLTDNEMEVLVNHPEMLTVPGVKGGHIIFSPKQAVDFGQLMIRKAGECKRRGK